MTTRRNALRLSHSLALLSTCALAACSSAPRNAANTGSDRSNDIAQDIGVLETSRPIVQDRETVSTWFDPPSLDARADTIAPATITVRSTIAGASTERRITRSRDRIHVEYVGSPQEWYLTRHAIDPRRALGQLVDHREKAILDYYETDLRDERIATGWMDALALGFPVTTLAHMTRTGERATIAGVEAQRLLSGDTLEVWWSDELIMPLRVRDLRDENAYRLEVTSIDARIDGALLQDPERRYTQYPRMDIVDWREEHHGHDGAPTNAHAGHDH